jgi:hypothetical protein
MAAYSVGSHRCTPTAGAAVTHNTVNDASSFGGVGLKRIRETIFSLASKKRIVRLRWD